jgi:8-oxo-dGTP pyrophosphatase MutT (NUDIX family)
MTELLRTFPHRLAVDLARPLPGPKAQFEMAPRPRRKAEHDDKAPPDAKVNGVLILLYPNDDEIHLPLILRPTYPGVHSGQVSLPGGRIEPCDDDVVETALRETEEEIGVLPSDVQILGQLSPLYIGASNNIVHPSVGWIESRPVFHTDDREVALLIEAPLNALLNPDNAHRETRTFNRRTAEVPYFSICDQIVWGATAMIVGELLALPSIRQLQ